MPQGNKKKKKNHQRENRELKSMSRKQEKTKFMTQEFKDQNGLLVDGRLVCRHFLLGRCMKEGECQLEHAQGYNDIIKEVCKFYIQGFCLKGESCPFMHKSFPCKFFHWKRKCLQEQNCRFSHEPLNDVTEKLLEEAMKQERALYELANKNKEELSEQQTNVVENKPAEENKNLDFLTQPLRPSFYNSTDAERERPGDPDVTKLCVLGADQPDSSSANTADQQEPVCYSVEAVLGPQLSRTFSSFTKTPVSQDSSSVSDPHTSPNGAYADQSKVPYSVEAVLSSYTAADNSSNGQTPDPPSEQVVFYAPKVISKEINTPSFIKEVPRLRIVDNSCQQATPKSFSSPEVKNSVISDSVPLLFHTTEEQGELYHPWRSASSTSRESEYSFRGTEPHKISAGQTCPPKRLSQLKPDLSKGGVSVPDKPVTTCNKRSDAANVAVHRFQISQILPNPKKKNSHVQTGAIEHNFSSASKKTCSETASLGDFSSGNGKAQTRLFSSLFATPLTDSVTPGSNSSTASKKPQQSEEVRIPSSPFARLFASPLSENPPSFPCSETQAAESAAHSCMQQSAGNAAAHFKQRDSGLRFLPSQTITSHSQTSSESSQSTKTENDAVKQSSATVCSVVSGSPCDLSSSWTNQSLPDALSPKETSAPSVLKSLFVQLGPYPEDGEQKGPSQSGDQFGDEKEEDISKKQKKQKQDKSRKV